MMEVFVILFIIKFTSHLTQRMWAEMGRLMA